MSDKRKDGRSFNQMRPIKIRYNSFGYADSSVLFECGRTKVLASVSLQDNVPHFLRGQKTGWLNAEYEMLPCATHKRNMRESTQHHRSSRSVEISRLIGRVLRSVVDVSLLPEKTIIIDCDVLQADGGTRVASITAASLALKVAVNNWLNKKIIEKNILKEEIAAISVGIFNNNFLLDLSYGEDLRADTDLNFILTKSKKIIEIQGTAEKNPITWDEFENLKNLAQEGIDQLFKITSKFTYTKSLSNHHPKNKNITHKPALFSLSKRFEKNT